MRLVTPNKQGAGQDKGQGQGHGKRFYHTCKPLIQGFNGLRRMQAVQVELPGSARHASVVGDEYPLSSLRMRRQGLRPGAAGDQSFSDGFAVTPFVQPYLDPSLDLRREAKDRPSNCTICQRFSQHQPQVYGLQVVTYTR